MSENTTTTSQPKIIDAKEANFFDRDCSLTSRMLTIGLLHVTGAWHRGSKLFVRFLPSIVLASGVIIVFGFRNPSIKGVAIVIGAAAISLAVRVALRPNAIFSPLSVPKSVLDCGLTGEVLTARILDIAEELVDGVSSHAVVNPLQPFVPLPQAEVSGFKLTPDAFGELLREFFGFRRTRIGGEIVQSADNSLHLRLREIPDGRRIDVSIAGGIPLDTLLSQGAEALLRNVAPYNLAYANLKQLNTHAALEIATSGADDVNLSTRVRARCHVLRWLILHSLGRLEDAALALEQAYSISKYDIMVLGAIGEHTRDAAKIATPASRFWKHVLRSVETWTRDASDFDHWTINSAKTLGTQIRDRREAAEKFINAACGELHKARSVRNSIRNRLLHPYTLASEIVTLITTMNKHLFDSRQLLDKAASVDSDDSYSSILQRVSAHEERLAAWRPRGDDTLWNEANKILEDNIVDTIRLSNTLNRMHDIVSPAVDYLTRFVKHHEEDYAPGGIAELRDMVRSDLSQAKALRSLDSVFKFPFGPTEAERWGKTIDSVALTHHLLEDFAANLLCRRSDVRKRARSLLRAHRRIRRWIERTTPTGETSGGKQF